jgi:hypothetical protein
VNIPAMPAPYNISTYMFINNSAGILKFYEQPFNTPQSIDLKLYNLFLYVTLYCEYPTSNDGFYLNVTKEPV